MVWFTWTFVPLMIVMPLVSAAAVKIATDVEVDRREVSRRMVWLVVATLVSLGLFAGAYFFVSEWVARFMWPLFFPLFFVFAAPIMKLKNPSWGNVQPVNTPVRAASTKPRVRENPVPWSAWMVGWAIWLATVIGVMGRLALPFEGYEFRSWIIALVLMIVTAPIGMIIGPICVRMVMYEPEPMDAQDSEQLAEAYTRYRIWRAWTFCIMAIVMTAVCSLGLAAVAWMPESRTLGWVGAGVGSAIGIGGAMVGVLFSKERVRIANLLRELSAERELDTGVS